MLGSALRHVGRQARGVQSARGLQSFYQAEVTSIGALLDLATVLPDSAIGPWGSPAAALAPQSSGLGS